MAEVIVSPAARNDISNILAWTFDNFGDAAERRYHKLLIQSIFDIVANPRRVGCIERDEIDTSARIYHLVHSRRQFPAIDRVAKPRHFLLFRFIRADLVEIGRVLWLLRSTKRRRIGRGRGLLLIVNITWGASTFLPADQTPDILTCGAVDDIAG